MANLSQQKRLRMLDFLQKVREKNKDDNEALIAINEIENEITEKKYGLVWEEHSEEVEERMVNEVPVFDEDESKEIRLDDDSKYNFLLEGDNLHSLHLLEKTCKEAVDVIYIDPPYNTGKEFIYNDDLVSDSDCFQHSKWLSFMAKRLKIAKKLLKPTGLLYISIDDNEQSNLKLLCDGIFGEENFIGCLIHQRAKGGGQAKNIVKGHDYILLYAKDATRDLPLGRRKVIQGKTVTIDGEEYIKNDDVIRTQFGKYDKGDGDRRCFYEELVKYKGEKKKKQVDEKIKKGEYFLEENRFGMHTICEYIPVKGAVSKIYSIIKILSEEGKNDLNETGVGDFSYPKPVELIKQLVEFSSVTNKDALVLDFFAGSGTTGQAVLELNSDDGGDRRFILCTNNENNICDDVTYPRLKTVITGARQDGSEYSRGIRAGLKYYHTSYVDKKSETLTDDLLCHINEMIQLEYGVKIDKEKYISILTDEDADELEKNWNNYQNICCIYISRKVLLTASQRDLFNSKKCLVIPDYYFNTELKEAGEV